MWLERDTVAFGITQPLRVADGEVRVRLPVGRTTGGRVLYDDDDLSAEPEGRELRLSVDYGAPLPQDIGRWQVLAVERLAPGHDPDRAPETLIFGKVDLGVLIGFRRRGGLQRRARRLFCAGSSDFLPARARSGCLDIAPFRTRIVIRRRRASPKARTCREQVRNVSRRNLLGALATLGAAASLRFRSASATAPAPGAMLMRPIPARESRCR